MTKKKKQKKWFINWWGKINPTWQAIISIGIVFSFGFGVGIFIEQGQHSMELIKLDQQHNNELQRQHDEFEEKLSDIKKQLDDCRHQYRLLEIENKKGGDEK